MTFLRCCCSTGGGGGTDCSYCSAKLRPIELPSVGRPIADQFHAFGTDGIYPQWFNGIVQDKALTLRFRLKVRKISTNTVIVDMDHSGTGENRRARPDCCQAYWCFDGVGFPCDAKCPDAELQPVPRMPNGPWPYGGTVTPVSGCGNQKTFTNYTTAYQTDDWCGTSGTAGQYDWWCAQYRYTTPQFTVPMGGTSRNIAVHVVVPHKADAFLLTHAQAGPCTTAGHCSYGMDCTASSEISALDAAGFAWSTLPETDGIWVGKTNTGEIRLLHNFVLADFAAGQILRTFRDWNGARFTKVVTRGDWEITALTSLAETSCCSAPAPDCPECHISFPERIPSTLKLDVNLPAGSVTIPESIGHPCHQIGSLRVRVATGYTQYLKEDADRYTQVNCGNGEAFSPQTLHWTRYRNIYACGYPTAPLNMDYATTAGASESCAGNGHSGCYPNGDWDASCNFVPWPSYAIDGYLDGYIWLDCDFIRFDAAAEQTMNPCAPVCPQTYPCFDAANLPHDEYLVAWRQHKVALGGDQCDPRGTYGYPYVYWRTSGASAWEIIPQTYGATVTIAS